MAELIVPSSTRVPGIHRPRLARGTALNLLGMGAPLVAGFVAIPLLVHALGVERFGVLTLAWIITGYFSLFDLGLGRALTQLIAARVSLSGEVKAPAVVWPALGLMLCMGLAGAVALAAVAPWLVASVLEIPPALQDETRRSLYVLAAGIPLVVMAAAYLGILTAFHEFGVLNAIRAPMGILTFVAPVLVLPLSRSLVAVTMSLVLVRLGACVAMAMACRRFMPPLRGARAEAAREDGGIRALLSFGAWMTVTNFVAPMMVYLDRFIVGSMLSVTAVAYYATPYEVITKALIVPGAVVGVLFPAFAASSAHDRARLQRLFTRGTKYIALLLFPAMLLVVAFAYEGLRAWLGQEFATNSAPVLQWLAIGVFLNSVAQLFLVLVLGVGRPDLSAKLQLLELPLYLVLLWWGIREYGILGAAIAWTVRVALDTVLLFAVSRHLLALHGAAAAHIAIGLTVLTVALALPLLAEAALARGAIVLMLGVLFTFVTWCWVLAPDERARIKAAYPHG